MVYTLPNLPVALPVVPIPEDVDLEAVVNFFNQTLGSLDEDSFTKDAVWRDTFALTGSIRTLYTSRTIAAAWKEISKTVKPTAFKVEGVPRVARPPGHAWVELRFTFETEGIPATTCSGFLSVVPGEDGKWKIWVIRTILEQLKSQPDVDKLEPVAAKLETDLSNGVNGLHITNGVNGVEDRFDCVIIGGGGAGISVGGRLKTLGVSYVVLDKNPEVGDSWKTRYSSAKLHTIREFAHLPFERTYPLPYQEYLAKDELAVAHRSWVSRYGINVWQSTTVLSGSWDAEREIWELSIERDGEKSKLTCSYIVFATGTRDGISPTYENREIFKGTTLHSSEYDSPSQWAGKHGVVVGAGSTGHDIADDMVGAGLASVTIIQRGKNMVVPIDWYRKGHDEVYGADIPTELSDRRFLSGPAAVGRLLTNLRLHAMIRAQPELFDGLEKAGFKLDRFGEITYYLLERFGGHYLDVGASAKIVDGQIKIKSDALPVRYTEDGLEFDNGDKLKADVIVFATGFVANPRIAATKLFGPKVGSQLKDCWGLDEEGEIRGGYKPSGHPAFWYHGGAIGQARYMSRYIALQIKAKTLGTPLPEYTATP